MREEKYSLLSTHSLCNSARKSTAACDPSRHAQYENSDCCHPPAADHQSTEGIQSPRLSKLLGAFILFANIHGIPVDTVGKKFVRTQSGLRTLQVFCSNLHRNAAEHSIARSIETKGLNCSAKNSNINFSVAQNCCDGLRFKVAGRQMDRDQSCVFL